MRWEGDWTLFQGLKRISERSFCESGDVGQGYDLGINEKLHSKDINAKIRFFSALERDIQHAMISRCLYNSSRNILPCHLARLLQNHHFVLAPWIYTQGSP